MPADAIQNPPDRIRTERVAPEDNLAEIVRDINAASWDDGNAMSAYSVPDLEHYLMQQDNVFVTCYVDSAKGPTLLGIASARFQTKPYDRERWLYVDEIDVCADQRRRGAGGALMKKLLALADENDCEELWLGTETDNAPANALYRSLDPDAEEAVIGYTYEMPD
ncbi:MAG: GNAT family N-acetyltransferase [Pseudomonadota bacterium]